MSSVKTIELWNECFDSMTQHEYDSKSLGELEDIYKDWLQERALKYKELLLSSEHVKQAIKDIGDFTAYYSSLESKAEAYDRLMNGGRKTLKEWANIFGTPVAVDKNLSGIVFDEIPELLRTVEAWRALHGYVGLIPSLLIDFNGDWTTSLTLPDGWEEK